MSILDAFTATHAVIQRAGDNRETVVCLAGHAHDAQVLAEELSALGDDTIYEVAPIASGRQLLGPDPLTAEERAVLAVMDLLGKNSFVADFTYRFEMPASMMVEMLARHLASAAARQPTVTRSEILSRHLGRLVTATAPVISPLNSRFTGTLKRHGKAKANRFQLLDPEDPDNVYLRFRVRDVRSLAESETGLTITLVHAA